MSPEGSLKALTEESRYIIFEILKNVRMSIGFLELFGTNLLNRPFLQRAVSTTQHHLYRISKQQLPLVKTKFKSGSRIKVNCPHINCDLSNLKR